MKNCYYFLLSWLFFYLGDILSRIGYFKIKDTYPFDFMWIYYSYNWLMVKSTQLQDKHIKRKGPWKDVEPTNNE